MNYITQFFTVYCLILLFIVQYAHCTTASPPSQALTIYKPNRRRLRSSGGWQGPYRIRGVGSNKCLDISGGHNRNGARLIIYNCHRGANQRWYINQQTRQFRIGSTNGKCLDIHGGHYNSRRNGAKLHAWSCHRGQNQRFKFHGKHIKAEGKMSGKCLDVWRASRRKGAKVILWPCHRGSNQQWKLEYTGRALRCPSGTRTIGKQGQKNDIGGCGIGGCNSRYRVNSIKQCAERCRRNRRCKSFSWAPIGGDRNHRSKNTCTIYDKTRANNKWGPNQVMCGRPKRKRRKRRKRRRKRRKRRRRRRRRLRCPRPSVTVGKPGQKNDIQGCGVGGCNSRYRVRSIRACERKCARNKKCKSFSWAPKGGDRNHKSKRVCTIYDTRTARSKWGPNQIMCGKPQKKRKRKKRRKRRRKRRRRVRRRSSNGWKCVLLDYGGDYQRKSCLRRRRGTYGRRIRKRGSSSRAYKRGFRMGLRSMGIRGVKRVARGRSAGVPLPPKIKLVFLNKK